MPQPPILVSTGFRNFRPLFRAGSSFVMRFGCESRAKFLKTYRRVIHFYDSRLSTATIGADVRRSSMSICEPSGTNHKTPRAGTTFMHSCTSAPRGLAQHLCLYRGESTPRRPAQDHPTVTVPRYVLYRQHSIFGAGLTMMI